MAATIIDGKALAKEVRAQIKQRVAELAEKTGKKPGLAVVLVGENPASQIYVRNKERAATNIGFTSKVIRLPEETSQEALLDLVDQLNRDDAVHGILVQMPLPRHIDVDAVIRAIDPDKDVDGFHVVNAGRLMVGQEGFQSCTPKGVMRMLKHLGVKIAGKHAVVVGRSNIVGKPMAMMLLRENATVTVCHSRTADLGAITRQADILVVAVGRSELIRGDMIKPGAIVIDVGMNRDEAGKLHGDVAFSEAVEVAGAITPVPGGVGPMTIAMLMENTLESFIAHG